MGIYLNPDSSKFEEAVNSAIYIDKTGLLTYTNSVLHTMQKYICISRPRRFGKSIVANMITAYYSRGCDARQLFSKFEIAKSDEFEKHLNQYNTISVVLLVRTRKASITCSNAWLQNSESESVFKNLSICLWWRNDVDLRYSSYIF